MCKPRHSDHGFVPHQELAQHLAKLIIDECCNRMEYRDDPRIVPRPTWQLYEHFGLDWKPEWQVSARGEWVKKD